MIIRAIETASTVYQDLSISMIAISRGKPRTERRVNKFHGASRSRFILHRRYSTRLLFLFIDYATQDADWDRRNFKLHGDSRQPLVDPIDQSVS